MMTMPVLMTLNDNILIYKDLFDHPSVKTLIRALRARVGSGTAANY